MAVRKEELALLVKSNRLEKGFTQAQLAEKCKLSLRSIQRIEKGEVNPREYTLKILTEVLEISSNFNKEEESSVEITKRKRIILSIGSGIIIFLFSLAFLAQSKEFPETHFESYLFWSSVIILICTIQWYIWTNQSLSRS